MEFPGPVPNVKDYQVSMDGDIVRGQFLTQIAGKDVYLTLAGHLGAKDGYATFDATEVKIGDLSIPASLVNDVLQKKLAEQRDQLKLPAMSRTSKSKMESSSSLRNSGWQVTSHLRNSWLPSPVKQNLPPAAHDSFPSSDFSNL